MKAPVVLILRDLPSSSFIIQSDLGTYALAYGPNAGGGCAVTVAAALDQASFPAPFTPMDGVYNSLDLLNFTDPALLHSALGQLSGEMNADLVSVRIESGRIFMVRWAGAFAVGWGRPSIRRRGRHRGRRDSCVARYLRRRCSIDGDGNTHDFGMDIGAVVAAWTTKSPPAQAGRGPRLCVLGIFNA